MSQRWMQSLARASARFILLLVGVSIFIIPTQAQSPEPVSITVQGMALIYNGPPSCTGCAEAMGAIAEKVGLKPMYVANPSEIPGLLTQAAVFIIGGTDDDLKPFEAFTPDIIKAIQDYIATGGRYWGICGGGYIAADLLFDKTGAPIRTFKIIPVEADDYSKTYEPRLEKIRWREQDRQMFFKAGPKFALTDKNTPVEIFGWYSDGSIAALQSAYGKGKVAISGPHPEAPRDWYDGTGWTSLEELAVGMLQDLLSDKPIQR